MSSSKASASVDPDRHQRAPRLDRCEPEPPSRGLGCHEVGHGALHPVPFILAELDYLIGTRVGTAAEMALLEEVARGAYRLETFTASDVQRARMVLEKFQDLNVGLADASIVVLAERYRIRDVLTLDERHFRPLRTLDGHPFRLIPADV
jgi:predicted nucleic acid-binding protein